jgi:hypothetical protein
MGIKAAERPKAKYLTSKPIHNAAWVQTDLEQSFQNFDNEIWKRLQKLTSKIEATDAPLRGTLLIKNALQQDTIKESLDWSDFKFQDFFNSQENANLPHSCLPFGSLGGPKEQPSIGKAQKDENLNYRMNPGFLKKYFLQKTLDFIILKTLFDHQMGDYSILAQGQKINPREMRVTKSFNDPQTRDKDTYTAFRTLLLKFYHYNKQFISHVRDKIYVTFLKV